MKNQGVNLTVLTLAVVLFMALLLPSMLLSQEKPGSYTYVSRNSLKPQNEGEKEDDKTLSPYFYVPGAADVEALPLKSTTADVNIIGVIADVKVTQEYMNTGKKPIEAVYIFPASTRAAVYSVKMYIGDRMLVAKIKEKEQARQEYNDALEAGKTATLLEQQRPNVFQMNVANILPGDTVKVELCYTELLIPEGGVYEFVYPTVVGPRYSNQPEATASANDKWVSNPYFHQGAAPTVMFDLFVTVSAGMPIKKLACPSHAMNIKYDGPSTAILGFTENHGFEGNRDVVIQYVLADAKIESGMLLFQGKSGEENFFLTMIQPPPRPTPEQIPAREYIFIVDVSGSMYGFPIETSKKLMKNLISNIRPTDKFNLMLFAGNASVMAERSLPATKENLDKALKLLDEQQGGGGTELLPALKRALSIEKDPGCSRTFVIATDGYVSIEKEAFQLIRDKLGEANFFAFGIGSSVNRYLTEGIANAGKGEAFVITDPSECDAKAEKFRKYIQSPVLTDIRVDFGGFGAYDVEPLNQPDVLAERPLILFGKYRGAASGTVKVTGVSGENPFSWKCDVSTLQPEARHEALRYLWARERIRNLSDFGEDDEATKATVTRLGLRYNLLTQYTSFIAVDSLIRNTDGRPVTVKQPLPLPKGVSDYAVGGAATGFQQGKNCSPSRVTGTSRCAEEKTAYKPTAADADADTDAGFAETTPTYRGGEEALQNFIRANLVVPAEALKAGLSGTLYVQFTVEANGCLTNIKVLRGPGYGLDEEAIRVLKLMRGQWMPGQRGGKTVAMQLTIPVHY